MKTKHAVYGTLVWGLLIGGLVSTADAQSYTPGTSLMAPYANPTGTSLFRRPNTYRPHGYQAYRGYGSTFQLSQPTHYIPYSRAQW